MDYSKPNVSLSWGHSLVGRHLLRAGRGRPRVPMSFYYFFEDDIRSLSLLHSILDELHKYIVEETLYSTALKRGAALP